MVIYYYYYYYLLVMCVIIGPLSNATRELLDAD